MSKLKQVTVRFGVGMDTAQPVRTFVKTIMHRHPLGFTHKHAFVLLFGKYYRLLPSCERGHLLVHIPEYHRDLPVRIEYRG